MPTSRTSRAASASTTASARSSCTPGPGYGGSCFPKDTLALLQTADEAGVEQRIVQDGRRGQRRPQGEHGRPRRQGARRRASRASASRVLGLAFKPNTDDMRDAPSIPLVNSAGRAGRRGQLPSIRSRASRPSKLLHGHRVRRRRLCRGQGCRCAGDRDRVGRVPRARPRPVRREPCAAR